MSKNTQRNIQKLLQDFESVSDLASQEAITVIDKIRRLMGRRLDQIARQLEKAGVDSMIGLETLLLTNRRFAKATLEI